MFKAPLHFMPAANTIAAPLTEVTSEVTCELLDPNGAQISLRLLGKLQGDQCALELHFVDCGTLSLQHKLILNLICTLSYGELWKWCK